MTVVPFKSPGMLALALLLCSGLVAFWFSGPDRTDAGAIPLADAPLVLESGTADPAPTMDTRPAPEPARSTSSLEEMQLRAKADEGARLFAARHFAEASVLLIPAAEAGYPQAQYQVGWMLYMGFGLPRDLEAAVGWFTRAAERGEASGMNALGTALREGKGAEQDRDAALRWYRAAAEQAHADGEVNLGFMYEMGYGTGKDAAQAARWYGQAAAQNHATAQFYLASLYEEGKGVAQDLDIARGWYRRAASQGNEYAKLALQRLEGSLPSGVPSPAASWAGER